MLLQKRDMTQKSTSEMPALEIHYYGHVPFSHSNPQSNYLHILVRIIVHVTYPALLNIRFTIPNFKP